jgi:replicative DNA helicase
MIEYDDNEVTVRAEQAVIGSLLLQNDALDRCSELEPSHFFRHDHRLMFAEIARQIGLNQRADAITIFERLKDQVVDCLPYMVQMQSSAVSAANIRKHADIIVEKASKRALAALSVEMGELASSHQPVAVCVDLMASKLEQIAHRKTATDPVMVSDMMSDYIDLLTSRMEGGQKPISTGHLHLDEMLGGGLERGTLTVVAARPGMGKTAFGLGVARNVAEDGTALFLSMEMAARQVTDRNVAALGKIPLGWLKNPSEDNHPGNMNTEYWNNLTVAIKKTQELKLYVDDQTGLNMIEIRAKCRKVKRQSGLDLVVIDQLSFITGGVGDKSWETTGQYTRACIALAKELDAAVILLCQLNRECEKRSDQRPIMSDLAVSGSIEQDAANIIFLYRDDVARKLPRNEHTDICEVQSVKQRQGEPGTIGMKYVGSQTRFEDLPYRWERMQESRDQGGQRKSKGFP